MTLRLTRVHEYHVIIDPSYQRTKLDGLARFYIRRCRNAMVVRPRLKPAVILTGWAMRVACVLQVSPFLVGLLLVAATIASYCSYVFSFGVFLYVAVVAPYCIVLSIGSHCGRSKPSSEEESTCRVCCDYLFGWWPTTRRWLRWRCDGCVSLRAPRSVPAVLAQKKESNRRGTGVVVPYRYRHRSCKARFSNQSALIDFSPLVRSKPPSPRSTALRSVFAVSSPDRSGQKFETTNTVT